MPPKPDEKAIADAQKQFKKLLDEAKQKQLEYNTKEFARLQKVKNLVLSHWTSLAEFLSAQQIAEAQKLSAESQNFNRFCTRILQENNYHQEIIQQQLNWKNYLQTEFNNKSNLITSLDLLFNSILPDSTVNSIQRNLQNNAILRPIIEQKSSIYEILLSAVREIVNQMNIIEKYIEFDCKLETFSENLAKNFPNSAMKKTVGEGDLIVLEEACQSACLLDLFNEREEFIATAENQEFVDLTLKNELFKPNPVPKCQEFDEKMNLIEVGKDTGKVQGKDAGKEPEVVTAEKPKKSKKKVVKVEIPDEIDPEIQEICEIFEFRSGNYQQFTEQSTVQELMNQVLKEALEQEIPVLTDENREEMNILRQQKLSNFRQKLSTLSIPQLEVASPPLNLQKLQILSQYQSMRVLFRSYLFDFLDLSAKNVIENPEFYGELNEVIKISYPKNQGTEEEVASSNAESTEGEEENSTEEVENKLNFENLQKLNQPTVDTSQKAEKLELMNFEEPPPRIVNNEFDEYNMKYISFRQIRSNYNKLNITSINEQIALYNQQKTFNSLRYQLELYYNRYIAVGTFNSSTGTDISRLLAQILTSEKRYFLGEKRLFEPVRYKIPYLSLQERILLSSSGSDIASTDIAKTSDKMKLEKIKEKITLLSAVNAEEIQKLNFSSGIVVTAGQGKGKLMKVQFQPGFKVSVPGILSMSNLAVRMSQFGVNLVGNGPVDGVENVNQFDIGVKLEEFYVKSQIQQPGEIENLMNLLVHLGLQYVKGVSSIEEGVESQIVVEKIEKLNQIKNLNINKLFTTRNALKQKIVDVKAEIHTTIQQIFTVSIYSISESLEFSQFISLCKGVQFLAQEIDVLDMKIVKTHYEVMKKSQVLEVASVKGKKQKSQLLEQQIKQNSEVLKQYYYMLKSGIIDQNWFTLETDLLKAQQSTNKKTKVKFEVFDPNNLEKVEETVQNHYKTPSLVQISKSFQIDVLRVPQTQQEINNWTPKLLLQEEINQSIQGHQAYEYDDQSVTQQEFLEENRQKAIIRPVRDQIKQLREILRKKSTNQQEKVTINMDINQELYSPSTKFFTAEKSQKIQRYSVINLIKKIPTINKQSNHISDFYARQNNLQKIYSYIDFAEETPISSSQKTKDFYLNPKPLLDYFIYPSSQSQQFNTFPGFPLLKISEIAKERSKYSIFDSILLWNNIINLNPDQQSVINPNLQINDEDKSNQQIQIEIQFPLELQCGIRSILDVQESIQFLQQAFLFQDFSSLLGSFFVGFYNSQTQTFDPDGVVSSSYKPETGVLQLKLFKTGIFAICQIKQNCNVIKGFYAVPEDGRGDGFSVSAASLECSKWQANGQQGEFNATNLGQSMTSDMLNSTQLTLPGGQKKSRFSYFSPNSILQRSGKLSETVTNLEGADVKIPFFTERAMQQFQVNNVVTHSVLIRFLLPSGIILTLRILPEGYEITDISEPQKCEFQHENPSNYTNYDDFTSEIKNFTTRVPNSVQSLVFTTISDLFHSLKQFGILLLPLSNFEISQLQIPPKGAEIEVEFARQISSLLAASSEGKSLVSSITHSPWNRNLPKQIQSYPSNNQFQKLQDDFDMSNFMIRGRLPPEEIENYVQIELKRLKKERKDMSTWMKEQRSVDEKAARKAVTTKVEQKVEKGAPSALGPGVYGMKTEAVEKRQKAIQDTLDWMEKYLSAVDLIREVKYEDSAVFVVNSSRIVVDGEKSAVNPLIYHQELFAAIDMPKQQGERPELPLTAAEIKKRDKALKLKGKGVEQGKEDEVEVQVPRCTQTKPYGGEIGQEYTVCVNKSRCGAFTVRCSAVPVDGPRNEDEEFCNMSVEGTEAHGGVFGLFGVSGEEIDCDSLLVGKIYELVVYMRLGSLG